MHGSEALSPQEGPSASRAVPARALPGPGAGTEANRVETRPRGAGSRSFESSVGPPAPPWPPPGPTDSVETRFSYSGCMYV